MKKIQQRQSENAKQTQSKTCADILMDYFSIIQNIEEQFGKFFLLIFILRFFEIVH